MSTLDITGRDYLPARYRGEGGGGGDRRRGAQPGCATSRQRLQLAREARRNAGGLEYAGRLALRELHPVLG